MSKGRAEGQFASTAAAATKPVDSGWWVAAALSLMALAAYVYWPRAPRQPDPRSPIIPTHNHIHD